GQRQRTRGGDDHADDREANRAKRPESASQVRVVIRTLAARWVADPAFSDRAASHQARRAFVVDLASVPVSGRTERRIERGGSLALRPADASLTTVRSGGSTRTERTERTERSYVPVTRARAPDADKGYVGPPGPPAHHWGFSGRRPIPRK